MKYRKKAVIVEAKMFIIGSFVDVAEWCNGRIIYDGKRVDNMRIDTLEGEMTAQRGDFIIQGVQGEFYPCKPDIFKQTYEIPS